MSKFDLRDISDRLAKSRDTEAVVFEFLGYLQAVRSDWRASLAFYEVSSDSLVNTYERQWNRLVRRDLQLPVGQLPARLVRKFFHPSAFFNHSDRRTLLSNLFSSSPSYEPEPSEAPLLRSLTPLPNWQSCVCLPLADKEDMLAMLVIASEKRGAFGSKVVGDIIPVKSMAALALSQHLYRDTRGRAKAATNGNGNGHATPVGASMAPAGADFQERLQRLNLLEEDNRAKAEKLEALAREIELLDKNSSEYKQELERVKGTLTALEEQSSEATQHLTEAFQQLNVANARNVEYQRTISFMKEVSLVLAEEHDPSQFASTMVTWFCEHFHVLRCSLMLLDDSRETLSMAAQRGIDPDLAGRVRVRIGQGIAGWVAHNRKPLFVRVRNEAASMSQSDRQDYNSDSFICAPLVYNNRLCGVLNLSNKKEGELFDQMDLDRAQLACALIAVVLGGHDVARRAAAWA